MTMDQKSIENPKYLGGMGIGNIHLKNFEILSKWWWKFSKELDFTVEKSGHEY